jgi:hypothetical protein
MDTKLRAITEDEWKLVLAIRSLWNNAIEAAAVTAETSPDRIRELKR